MYEVGTNAQDDTKKIVDQIKAINDAIKKPHKRPHINVNTQPETGGYYSLDKDVLEKLQQIIASGKINSHKNNIKLQDDNTVSEIEDLRHSREMAAQLTGNPGLQMSSPYLTSIPVLVMPSPSPVSPSFGYNNANSMQFRQTGMSSLLNSMQLSQPSYQTRQGFESPFQFQWPFASWFPILIRDPLLSVMNGGGWNNFIEVGQSADVCRRQKSTEDENVQDNIIDDEEVLKSLNRMNARQSRAVKKRTVSHQTRLQDVENTKKTKKIFSTKPLTTRKPVKQDYTEQDTKTVDEGDLRFPFGDFTLFGNRKPVAPSPGFFINRLKVRRGGVAIAGPGGVATAGRGGTAIVGPGGLAYTQPGGLAIAGPAARVVALAPDADLSSIISKLQAQDGSVPRSLQPIIEGKVVATGPVIYYHPNPS